MQKISVFKTTDDETFESKSEAQAHQNMLDLQELGLDTDVLKENADAVYGYVKQFRTIKPRAKKAEAAA